jgi:hypothetical protein
MALLDVDARRWSPSAPVGRGHRPDVQVAPTSGAAVDRWTPLSGEALLDRLRFTGRPRPLADPERVDHLRSLLDQGLADLPLPGPEGAAGWSAPLVVTKGGLRTTLGRRDGHHPGGSDAPGYSTSLACGALIGVLFRQLIATGSFGDPFAEALEALAVDPRQAGLRSWVDALPPAERHALAAEVRRQAEGLGRRWPTLDPAWHPRTDEPMRTLLAGGAVELSARVDLAIGRPGLDIASVAIVEITSGERRPEHRHDLHLCALVETLRHGAPPFSVATYYTRTGELDVDAVSDELLESAAHRTAAGVRAMVEDADSGADRVTVVGAASPGSVHPPADAAVGGSPR